MQDKPTVQRPYLVVVATDPSDVVANAGGLICDRVQQGWRVVVLTSAGADTRALRILGADIAPRESPPDDVREARTALMTSASLYAGDRTVRSDVDSALATKSTEVLMWGARSLAGATGVSHRLSAAAVAFKAHALRAADLPERVESTESFHTKCAPDVIARELDVAG